jgi:hypothetical protein
VDLLLIRRVGELQGESMAAEIAFKALTRQRYLSYDAFCREWDNTAKGVDEALTGHYPSRAQYYRWLRGDLINNRPGLANITLSRATFNRWYFGKTKTMPRLESCRVLEYMFGIPVQQLLHFPEEIEQESANDAATATGTNAGDSINPLINRREWTRDNLHELSEYFDAAISRSDSADIELLAHAWLSAETPQIIELDAGRRIGDSLVSVVEHRVVQLRRADDYMSGRTSHEIVRQEIRATGRLLKDAILSEQQTRRLLTATGELSQLASWVSADAGLYAQAVNYTELGILASRVAGNDPLTANIISTLSYQLANTGQPRKAAILARTAYAGAQRTASATTRALLLERIAWADAKSGDRSTCEWNLGLVEENFSNSDPDKDPDWVYWLSKEEIDVMAGRCYTQLGQPSNAVPLLSDAISGYDDTHIREISLYQSWLAEDYILLKEIQAAADVAIEVLQLGRIANSARIDERLRHLAVLLREHEKVQSVAEFLDQYETYLRR